MILCADDFGISPAVSEGILELVDQKKLSAVSCMMQGPGIDAMMRQLQRYVSDIDIGLHFVLTHEEPLSPLSPKTGLVNSKGRFHSFPKLLANVYQGIVNQESVEGELETQLKLFEVLLGRPPAFIDGHQHVQQLPIIRSAVAAIASSLKRAVPRLYVRVGGLPLGWLCRKAVDGLRSSHFFGNFVIALPGRATSRLMRRFHIPHNRYLLGYYNYEGGVRFESIFRRYLSLRPAAEDIFFCHPGYVDDALRLRDPVTESRTDVLQFLRSRKAKEMMEEAGIGLNTFSSSYDN